MTSSAKISCPCGLLQGRNSGFLDIYSLLSWFLRFFFSQHFPTCIRLPHIVIIINLAAVKGCSKQREKGDFRQLSQERLASWCPVSTEFSFLDFICSALMDKPLRWWMRHRRTWSGSPPTSRVCHLNSMWGFLACFRFGSWVERGEKRRRGWKQEKRKWRLE